VANGDEKLNLELFRPTRFLLRSHMTLDHICMLEIRLVGLILFGTPCFCKVADAPGTFVFFISVR